MAMDTREHLICECGHTGFLRRRENDQPYSNGWESYSLEGFEGGTANFEPSCNDMRQLLVSLNPKCPQCGQIGKVSYAKPRAQ
jgi:hypothetical protein